MSDMQPPRAAGPQFTTAVFMRIGIDRYTVADSIVGPVCVGWTGRGVSAVRLAGTDDAQAAFTRWYRERVGRRVVRAVELDDVARAACDRLHDPAAAAPAVDTDHLTPFERAVLASVERIPAGYARPCELVADDLAAACEPDAIARVLGDNPVPLIVPCHRVVHGDRCCSSHYVFGAQAQHRLLAAEGLDAAAVDRVIAGGYRYIENDGYFCLPTCGDVATRLGSPGVVGLRSLGEARERGLRPCGDCRPIAA